MLHCALKENVCYTCKAVVLQAYQQVALAQNKMKMSSVKTDASIKILEALETIYLTQLIEDKIMHT